MGLPFRENSPHVPLQSPHVNLKIYSWTGLFILTIPFAKKYPELFLGINHANKMILTQYWMGDDLLLIL